MAERGHLPRSDHRGFHVVLPSETWCTVMVHLGTTAYNLHMLWKTALLLLPPLGLAAVTLTFVDVVLGLMDVVHDWLGSVRPYVSNMCTRAGSRAWKSFSTFLCFFPCCILASQFCVFVACIPHSFLLWTLTEFRWPTSNFR